MIRARKTSRWLLVLAFTMRLSSLCWLAVTSIGTGAGMIGTLPKALHYTISFMGRDTSYRPEIDGLRALAVIAVIMFHAKIALSGGYLGVDIFFVISGYLITALIVKDL